MDASAFTHFVFVDLENVKIIDLSPIAGRSVHVTVLIGKVQKRMETSFALQMHQYSAQVTPIEVGASGHNALDILLGYHLGRAAIRSPHASFFIVSGDTDFDPLVTHLNANGTQVSRHHTFAALPFLAAPKKSGASKAPFAAKPVAVASTPASPPAKNATLDKFGKFIVHLRNSPPANQKKLEHLIAGYFQPSLPTGGMKGVISKLVSGKVIAIDPDGKVRCL